jgi:DNA-binding HxlR family transcriptional regulator
MKHNLIQKGVPKGSARRIDYWLIKKGKKLVPLIEKMSEILSGDS